MYTVLVVFNSDILTKHAQIILTCKEKQFVTKLTLPCYVQHKPWELFLEVSQEEFFKMLKETGGQFTVKEKREREKKKVVGRFLRREQREYTSTLKRPERY